MGGTRSHNALVSPQAPCTAQNTSALFFKKAPQRNQTRHIYSNMSTFTDVIANGQNNNPADSKSMSRLVTVRDANSPAHQEGTINHLKRLAAPSPHKISTSRRVSIQESQKIG